MLVIRGASSSKKDGRLWKPALIDDPSRTHSVPFHKVLGWISAYLRFPEKGAVELALLVQLRILCARFSFNALARRAS